MDLPTYTPVLYFGLGVVAGVAGIFGYALWLQKQETLEVPKRARRWDKVTSLKFHYDYDIRAKANGTLADLSAELFNVISKSVRADDNFRKHGQSTEVVYTVVIDGAVHFTQRPISEPLQGVPVLPDDKA